MTTLELSGLAQLGDADRARVAATLANVRLLRGKLPPEAEQTLDEVEAILAGIASGSLTDPLAEARDLTTTEAAKILRCSRPHLIRLLEDGRIPFHKVGRDRRITTTDVRSYLEAREELKREVAAVRAARLPVNQSIAKELGLTPEEAAEIGL
jgi:excisionase family DNA binding protein